MGRKKEGGGSDEFNVYIVEYLFDSSLGVP
jgi:hypothetical protein